MQFLPKEYARCDAWAKEIFSEFVTARGHEIIKSHEDYNHDLVTFFNGRHWFFELEVKTGYGWRDEQDFPFETVSFLGRKRRMHNINPFYYVVICRETLAAIMCHSSDIYDALYFERVDLSQKQRLGKDDFYRVPKGKCRFFSLNI